MIFEYGKNDWKNLDLGEKNCFILTNGLGGFQSLSIIGSATRNDQSLFMSAKKAPNVRFHFLSNLLETFSINGKDYVLTSQKMYEGEDLRGFQYLTSFTYDNLPKWIYEIDGVKITKEICMQHGKNRIGIRYQVEGMEKRDISLKVVPLLRFTLKNNALSEMEAEKMKIDMSKHCLQVNEDQLFFQTNGSVKQYEKRIFGPMYFTQDERDGRDFIGYCTHCFSVEFNGKTDMEIIFGDKDIEEDFVVADMLENEKKYQQSILQQATVHSKLGRQLAVSTDAYLVDRESTNGKTIIAGYPFFEDWGRDTMISLAGTTLVTGRFEACKSILNTFAKYVKSGLLPNLFPEGDIQPMYNSVDAPLLFINAVYDYVQFSRDESIVSQMWPQMEEIIEAYMHGTDFHIKMDEDCLISAGDDLEQLTWMDVRVGNYLPTPRHGKPVEINAYWYNDLCIMEQFTQIMEKDESQDAEREKWRRKGQEYHELAKKVKKSFLDKFWNEKENCLKDVLTGNAEENQVRCNQIWVLTMPYTMLSLEQEKAVLEKIRTELYTTVGLRTLTQKDAAFRGIYIGDMVNRDRAYHQGTVWAYPLGAYYRAVIRCMEKDSDYAECMREHVEEGFQELEKWLSEGCVGHLAEIYDGERPTVSRGCFAQAWSDAEVLRAVYDWEKYNN